MKIKGLLGVLLAPLAYADTIGFGILGDSVDGCDIPSVYLSYIAEDVFAKVQQGGNRACKSATSADISVERDFGHISIEVGYDLRGVSFSGPSLEGGDAIFYGSMSAASASVNYDFDLGSVNMEAGWDIPGEAPRLAVKYQKFSFSVEADTTLYRGLFSTLKSGWTRQFSDDWGVDIFFSYSHGIDKVPDPILWKSDQGLTPSAPPVFTYSYGIGFTRTVGD